jgi:hypothetical protein
MTDQNSSSLDDYSNNFGLPVDPNPGNVMSDMSHPDGTSNGGILSSLEGYASNALSSIESGAGKTLSAITAGVGSGISTVYGGVKQVGNDIVGSAENVVSFGTNKIYIFMALAVVAIYVAGKAGLFKALK